MMYNPQRFKSDNFDEAFELMEKYPFATLISISENEPTVSHLPLTPTRVGNKIELVGHLARANAHWKILADSSVTTVFHGAHTYVTPKWYAENDVPTWNYSVVHVKGHVKLIESHSGIIDCLKELRSHVERQWPSGWNFFIPDDLSAPDVLTKSIVGFKITADDINFKRKLSQNRSQVDRLGVLKGLETRTDEQSQKVLANMRTLYSSDGGLK